MALASTVVWEVRTTGNDNNGGGFNTASSGTDYSQQDTPVLTVTDGTTSAAGSTTLTSATGGFTADMVGNVCHIYGGTNTVDSWYEIKSVVDSNTITLDRAPDDGVGGITGATVVVGGALASIGGLGFATTKSGVGNADQKAWIRGGTYILTTSTPNTPGGPISQIGVGAIFGYGTTRGDGGKPIIDVGAVTDITVIYMYPYISNHRYTANIIIDGKGNPNIIGIDCVNYNNGFVYYCEARNCTTGFQGSGCEWVGCIASNCVNGFNVSKAAYCRATGCSGYGFKVDMAIHCIADHNGDVGITAASYTHRYYSCISYANASHGFYMDAYSNTPAVNCVAVSNGGYGFTWGSNNKGVALLRCASYANTSGAFVRSTHVEDVIYLSGDPFIDGPNGDFRLNDTAGSVLKDAGIHIPSQQDKTDLNAFDSAIASSGGTPVVIPGPSKTKWWV